MTEHERPQTMRELLRRRGVGGRPLPPDDEVYQSGGVFVFLPHDDQDQSAQDDAPAG